LVRIVCVVDGCRGAEVVLVRWGGEHGVCSAFLMEIFPGVVGGVVVLYGGRCGPMSYGDSVSRSSSVLCSLPFGRLLVRLRFLGGWFTWRARRLYRRGLV